MNNLNRNEWVRLGALTWGLAALATAVVGIVALSRLGGDEDEDEESQVYADVPFPVTYTDVTRANAMKAGIKDLSDDLKLASLKSWVGQINPTPVTYDDEDQVMDYTDGVAHRLVEDYMSALSNGTADDWLLENEDLIALVYSYEANRALLKV